MKKHFSKHWKSSRKPRKQIKYLANAPLHLKRKFMSANLSKELRKKYGKRSLPVRKGDTVRIMRGKFKKKTGKISVVNAKKIKIEIEGMQIKKQDGSKANVKFNPQFLQITELNLEDRKRNKAFVPGEKNKSEGGNKDAS
ncbi:MAG: 50S ribosomal protein L24 [Nanoarchaeota archaeon]